LEEEVSSARYGLAMLFVFVIVGAVLFVFFVLGFVSYELKWSIVFTFAILFLVGALCALVIVDRWWVVGFEMLFLGLVVVAAVCGSGSIVVGFTMME